MWRNKDHEETPPFFGRRTGGHPVVRGSVRMPIGVSAVRREQSIMLSSPLTVRRWTERHTPVSSSAYSGNAGRGRQGRGNQGCGDGERGDHGGSLAGGIKAAARVRAEREETGWER